MNTVIVKDDVMNKRTHKRIYFEEHISEEEYQSRLMQKRKLSYAMRMHNKEAEEQYLYEHKNGYCPICGMLLPLSGECDCGYTK